MSLSVGKREACLVNVHTRNYEIDIGCGHTDNRLNFTTAQRNRVINLVTLCETRFVVPADRVSIPRIRKIFTQFNTSFQTLYAPLMSHKHPRANFIPCAYRNICVPRVVRRRIETSYIEAYKYVCE